MSYKFRIKLFAIESILCILLVYLLEIEQVGANPNGRIITLPQGRIKGRLSETRNGTFFMEYMAIPYCQEPKRFKSCRWPPPPWGICNSTDDNCTEIKDGTHPAPPCFQMKGSQRIGDENCLYLNVATPANHNNYFVLKNMPVMVVFHGGL